MRITGLYAALSTLLILLLAARVIVYRRTHKIGLGDADDAELRRRIRVHGNAIEYVPLGLLLLLLLELNQTVPLLLHVFGVLLLLGRLAHAWGVSHNSGVSNGRVLGVVLTVGAMVAMAVTLLLQYVGMQVIGVH
jgi:uncharacterized membrane protein YecN with MAPEG domain